LPGEMPDNEGKADYRSLIDGQTFFRRTLIILTLWPKKFIKKMFVSPFWEGEE
jgi:hypothetical protein